MKLTDDQLIQQTKLSVSRERSATLEVIRYFQEIYDRELYLYRGYSSMFEMVTKEFGYCAGSAQIRINAMRLVKELPSVAVKIDQGDLSLTVVSMAQTFLAAERKINKSYTPTQKLELIESLIGNSKREAEAQLVALNPEFIKRESVRPINAEQSRLNVTISVDLQKKLEHLKSLMVHVDPSMSYESLLEKLADIALKKLDPSNRPTHKAAPKMSSTQKAKKSVALQLTNRSLHPDEVKQKSIAIRSRYIPQNIKLRVWQRDQGRCTYLDPSTKRQCSSTHFVQLDHVREFSKGGEHTEKNLRLLCGAHNRLRNNLRF